MTYELRSDNLVVIERRDLQELVTTLRDDGYTTVGPVLRNGAIEFAEIDSVNELPVGWANVASAGHYQLEPRADDRVFGYTVGSNSARRFLHPPATVLWRAMRSEEGGLILQSEIHETPRYALVGVRPCDVRAIEIQDRVLCGGKFQDPVYTARRRDAFVIAVDCGRAVSTCFCSAMKCGPEAQSGYDIALTEVSDSNRHYFTARSGSELGSGLLARVPHHDATTEERAAAKQEVSSAHDQMDQKFDAAGVKDLLQGAYDSSVWEIAARRCVNCANCTLVCPTCFCTTVQDSTDLSGTHAERSRRWDSCFTMDYSYIHGGSARSTASARYRHWVMHKLANWHDQFGESGCVGCGRCIAWCPIGIDIREEVNALRVELHANAAAPVLENAHGES